MQPPKKTGFSFGVILGAIVGTGALVLAHHKEGKVIRKKVIEELQTLKEKYPEQVDTIEDIISSALSEAKVLTRELKEFRSMGLNNTTSPKATTKKKSNTFTRSGKPV